MAKCQYCQQSLTLEDHEKVISQKGEMLRDTFMTIDVKFSGTKLCKNCKACALQMFVLFLHPDPDKAVSGAHSIEF
jgi:hypothetical protein